MCPRGTLCRRCWGLQDEEIADSIEQNLYADNFLNDRRFCEAYVHDKVAYQSWGRLKIQASLRALQLPESEIRSALENIDETAYFDNLRKLIRARNVPAKATPKTNVSVSSSNAALPTKKSKGLGIRI